MYGREVACQHFRQVGEAAGGKLEEEREKAGRRRLGPDQCPDTIRQFGAGIMQRTTFAKEISVKI